tara:strand:+ start:439 stop:945 length:507 start_codon:yes stop_codon:yes gene_type:complete
MGQEFVIKSTALEDKINQLLPSQGGAQAGVDLSASTTIIPIVDLTESAEGAQVRADLQTALSLNDVTSFNTSGATVTIVSTTGYYRIFGTVNASGTGSSVLKLTDGTTDKQIFVYATGTTAQNAVIPFDFVIFLPAGQSLVSETDANIKNVIVSKQIADINGNLTSPS